MLTGARKSEVGGMAWTEIDRERVLWVLPADLAAGGTPTPGGQSEHLRREEMKALVACKAAVGPGRGSTFSVLTDAGD